MHDEGLAVILEIKLRRNGRVIIEADKDLGDTTRLRQALSGFGLAAPPLMVSADPGHKDSTVFWAMTEHGPEVLKKEPPTHKMAVTSTAEQQDDEALVQGLARAIVHGATGGSTWDESTDVRRAFAVSAAKSGLAHLRAQGLMRTPEDGHLAGELAGMKVAMEMCRERADKAKAQVRALTAKAEEANAACEQWGRDTSSWARDDAGDPVRHAAYAKLRQDLATTEQAYQREKAAREAEAQKALAAAEREAKTATRLGAAVEARDSAEKALASARAQIDELHAKLEAYEVGP